MSQGFTKGTPIDTDPTLSLNSDIVVPSQKAIKDYVDTGLASKVPSTRNITINGLTQDLSADRTWTVTTSPGVFTSSIGVDTNDLNASITSDGILTITPTTNLKITGLQGGAAGRSITLFNGSANYTLFIEHNSSSSTATNRIFNPDRNFMVLLPQESLTLTYRSDLSLWYTQRLGLATQFDYFSDFLVAGVSGNSGNLDCWAQLGAGTPNTAAFAIRTGVLGMTLPATANNYIHIGTATATTTSMGDAVASVSRFMCTRVAVAQLPVVTTRDYELKLGFLLAKNASYLANSGAFWYLDRNFANWQCITTPSAAGQTIVDSGIPATAGTGASNFLHLGVVQLVGPSGGSVVANCCFFAVDSNGTISFGSRLQTTNLPTQGYDVSADLFRVATGTSGNMLYIDYLGYKGNALR